MNMEKESRTWHVFLFDKKNDIPFDEFDHRCRNLRMIRMDDDVLPGVMYRGTHDECAYYLDGLISLIEPEKRPKDMPDLTYGILHDSVPDDTDEKHYSWLTIQGNQIPMMPKESDMDRAALAWDLSERQEHEPILFSKQPNKTGQSDFIANVEILDLKWTTRTIILFSPARLLSFVRERMLGTTTRILDNPSNPKKWGHAANQYRRLHPRMLHPYDVFECGACGITKTEWDDSIRELDEAVDYCRMIREERRFRDDQRTQIILAWASILAAYQALIEIKPTIRGIQPIFRMWMILPEWIRYSNDLLLLILCLLAGIASTIWIARS
ncbi:hypothetical protein [Bifidobacterium sp. SO1]|uniref:hypothetical protein n=1 Tax=Bifidobacterium sp. SO1 TaxID=2809029 RepID=UPI001BDBBF4F|nr:hypothetical protein [Bifidobacterium sp. SO1]MBT1162785.1 hypothetical protein [Bifidobacterium sp. SO1]